MKKIILFFVTVFIVSGCGGGSSLPDSDTLDSYKANTQSSETQSKEPTINPNSARSLKGCQYVNPINGECEG